MYSRASEENCENKSYDNDILRVCCEANQGMRKYMEDEVSIDIETTEGGRTAFLGVFDGHGGKDASLYAKDHLYDNIKLQNGFYNDDTDVVKSAIRDGFIKTHWDMMRVVETWPKRKEGHNSTSGTTATIAIIRDNKLFIAHVGDSAAVIATKEEEKFNSVDLTIDHKPENINEKARIESLGGRVAVTNGVPRVVWKRPVRNQSPVDPCKYEYVPFLAVSRALGDLWSYDSERKEFIVSPEPEVTCIDIEPNFHKFIILASDGLWGVMNGREAVQLVTEFELRSNVGPEVRNSSKHLIKESLQLWQKKRSRADNVTAVVAFFDDEFKEFEECADTDICSGNEEDTPPMINANSNTSLVRQMAFSTKFPSDTCELELNKTEVSEGVPLELVSQGKRKNENAASPGYQKKLKTTLNSPVILEDSHQSNIITVLSTESLHELQLDEDLGFADDESDDPPSSTDEKIMSHKLGSNSIYKVPVVQGAK